MNDIAGMRIWQAVREITKGLPYVFVIRKFGTTFTLVSEVIRPTVEEFGMACVDAEEVPGAGQDLLAKVHMLVERADLIIAEVSHESPNVFYEIGYATALDKPLVFLLQQGHNMATDLRGRLHIEYQESPAGLAALREQLRLELRTQLYSETALLRDMLLAPTPRPAFIVANPKYPTRRSRIQGQVYDTRTFGDYLGVRGLTTAFGLMLGERESVELISARHADPDLLDRDASLYLIGSDKVNPFTAKALEHVQQAAELLWRFGPAPGYDAREDDYPVMLYRCVGGREQALEAKFRHVGEAVIFSQDYGIVVRAPHAGGSPERLVMVMAGAHSLGTGAACIAATSSEHIRAIAAMLESECGVSLADKSRAFWVLVRGTASARDNLLDPEDVAIEEVGVYG